MLGVSIPNFEFIIELFYPNMLHTMFCELAGKLAYSNPMPTK